jgi:predicted SnoaL-like aldol condensation-catalyzing enzyme
VDQEKDLSLVAARTVTEFLRAFMTGNIDKASKMVREDFWFRAPLQDGRGDKAAYFAGVEKKTQFIRAFRILRQWADGDDVSTVYELDIETAEGAATMAVSEWHKVEAGQLASTFMIFHGSSRAAQLLGNALSAHH